MQIPDQTEQMGRRIAMGMLLVLVFLSLYLALTRIYQVDEAQNVFTARILASHWEERHNLWIEIWHLWPLAWLAARSQEAVGLFHESRLFMVAVFWLNILLITLNCDVPWKSTRFLWILLGAATLAPLWDYGFEVRHDNLLLLFFLLYFFCFRMKGGNFRVISFLVGALAAVLQFITFKSFAYWFPMACLFLALRPHGWSFSRLSTFLFACLGFSAVSVLVLILLKISGRLQFLLDGFSIGISLSSNPPVRFAPWDTLARLFHQTPLLLGISSAALVHTAALIQSSWKEHCTWEGLFPEVFLVILAGFLFLVNPAPHPYNLILLVPFVFVLAVRWLQPFLEFLNTGHPFSFLFAGLLVFTHFAPFLKATLRHLEFTNDRQEELMRLAEDMTDPTRDRVYDAAGLVASRESIGKQWFLHSLFMDRFYRGQLPSVRQMLQEKPASVLIPNYRFSWLQKGDVAFIQANYIPLSNDFLVLGQTLRAPQRDFTCIQSGNYQISGGTNGTESGAKTVLLDGARITLPSIQPLSKGVHSFQWEDDSGILVAWVGPKLTQLPQLKPGDSSRFFTNWY